VGGEVFCLLVAGLLHIGWVVGFSRPVAVHVLSEFVDEREESFRVFEQIRGREETSASADGEHFVDVVVFGGGHEDHKVGDVGRVDGVLSGLAPSQRGAPGISAHAEQLDLDPVGLAAVQFDAHRAGLFGCEHHAVAAAVKDPVGAGVVHPHIHAHRPVGWVAQIDIHVCLFRQIPVPGRTRQFDPRPL